MQAGSRVAVVNLDIVGALNPVLPIVAELASRGCDVRYYCSKQDFADAVERAGAKCVILDGYLGRWKDLLAEEAPWLEAHGYSAAMAAAPPLEPQSSLAQQWLRYGLPAGVCLARRLLEAWSTEQWTPELVFYNAQLVWPLLAAARQQVLCASFSTYPAPGCTMHLHDFPAEQHQEWDKAFASHPAIKQANKIAKEVFGVDVLSTQLLCRHFNQKLNVVFSLRALGGKVPEHQQALLDDSTFLFVGSTGDSQLHSSGLVASESASEQPERVSPSADAPWNVQDGVKIVIVTLGTLTVEMRWELPEHRSSLGLFTGRAFCERLWGELLQSFAGRSDVRVILGTGTKPEVSCILGELPTNFVAMSYFDQPAALARADLFITHGGANSIKEGLLAGVPLIVVPFCVDQPSNGRAIEKSGAGVCFPDIMATPQGELAMAMECTLWGCTGHRQRSCSRQLGSALHSAGGSQAVVEALATLMQSGTGREKDCAATSGLGGA